MKSLTPEKIAAVTGGVFLGGGEAPGREISFITTDSREAGPDCLFAALKGERFDGYDFIPDVMEKGALCALCTRPAEGHACVVVDSVEDALQKLAAYWRGLFDIPVVGIVGSVGKTTAKEMTAAVLSQRFRTLKTEGNFNNELGVPLTLFRLRSEHEAAVVEMGISDFGEMTRLARMVRPTVCLMTVIGCCHLEKLGSLEGVLKAKAEVFPLMPEGALAVLNGDDALLRGYDPGIEKVTYGMSEGCAVRAENVTVRGFEGTDLDVVYGE
ncbi:MAG: UDP-N-acetylmuramoyl-tripeptide--D-alanyl-D-alanine ligase, partial [Oscillospiraceae bacterium]|nr:UDP-N-acetylmuramoyl-tripeptide--D-alanyl-D-alanine ligase [Oscillospiraceae bacterium]